MKGGKRPGRKRQKKGVKGEVVRGGGSGDEGWKC